MSRAAFAPSILLRLSHPLLPRFLNPHHLFRASLVAVVGATGGVGRLLVSRLLSSITPDSSLPTQPPLTGPLITHVRVLTRNPISARKCLPVSDKLDVVYLPAMQHAESDALRAALVGAAVLVICSGTTAFPTKAWRGGNTPRAVDDVGVRRLAGAVDGVAIRRIVLLSTVGTSRTQEFPFSMLNLFGVFDAKRAGEWHVRQAALSGGFAYALVRPGRLVGAPHSNIGMLRSEPHPRMRGIRVEPGDCVIGDVSRAAVADVLVLACKWDLNKDLDFCLVHDWGDSPGMSRWESLLSKVQGSRRIAEMDSSV